MNQNPNMQQNMAVDPNVNQNPNQTNMYDMNIDNSRVFANPTMNAGQNPYINPQANNMNAMNTQNQSGFNNGDFIKGALIGAAVTYLLTNKGAQENLMQAVSKGTELFQAGMEELKERYEDARAQMEANSQK